MRNPRCGGCRRILLLVGLGLAPVVALSATDVHGAEEPAREVSDELARREQDLLRQYRELERSFLRRAA